MTITNRESNFQIFKSVTSNLISGLSSGMLNYGIGLMLLNQTNLAISFGVELMIAPIVGLLLLVPIGNCVDTYSHKRILIISMLIRIILLILLRLTIDRFDGVAKFILIIPFVAINAGLGNLSSTTYFASIHELVNSQKINSYNSSNSSAGALSNILAPILGVGVYSILGFDIFILVEIISSIIAFGILMLMHFYPVETTSLSEHSTQKDLKVKFMDGLNYMLHDKLIINIVTLSVFLNFILAAVNVGLPYLIKNELGSQIKLIGLVDPFASLGILLGSLFLNFFPFEKRFNLKLIICFGIESVSFILMGLIFLKPGSFVVNLIILGVVVFMIGFSISVLNVSTSVKLQEVVPNKMLGRVRSMLVTACSISLPIGTLVYSLLFDFISNGFIILIINGVVGIIYMILLFPFLRRKTS